MLECGDDAMTLTVRRRHAEQLQLDRGEPIQRFESYLVVRCPAAPWWQRFVTLSLCRGGRFCWFVSQ